VPADAGDAPAPPARALAPTPPTPKPWAWGVLAALAAVALVAGAWWWLASGDGRLVDPLDYVAPDADLLGHARLAVIWARAAPGNEAGESIERETGLRPDEVESLWIVWHRPADEVGWAVIRTRVRYTRDKILSRLRDVEASDVGGHVMHVGRPLHADGKAAVAFLDPRTLLAGSIAGVRLALERDKGQRVGGRAGPAHAEFLLRPGAALPFHLPGLAGLRGARLALDVGDKATLRGTAKLAGAEEAAMTRDTLEGAVQLGRLTLQARHFLGAPGAEAGLALERLLSGVKLESVGEDVMIEAEGDAAEVMRGLAALPEMLKR